MPDRQSINGLHQLLVCHFHEDWRADYHSTAEAVAHFARLEPVTVVRDASQRIERMLASVPASDLDQAIVHLGAAIDPPALGLTTAEWLRQVAANLREHLRDQGTR
jgi:hypothetical protein